VCTADSLDRLPGVHGLDQSFQRFEVALLNEFNRSLILKVTVGCVEKDARARFVTSIEVNDGHPNAVHTAKLWLQAACIVGFVGFVTGFVTGIQTEETIPRSAGAKVGELFRPVTNPLDIWGHYK
jgi:hypothetical protein